MVLQFIISDSWLNYRNILFFLKKIQQKPVWTLTDAKPSMVRYGTVRYVLLAVVDCCHYGRVLLLRARSG
jgi:hypothetical protein